MAARPSIDRAVRILGVLLAEESGERRTPRPREVLAAVRRFESVRFDGADGQDADGFLFQYGVTDFTGPPLFSVGLVRQLEHSDQEGEHESYTQVRCEFLFEPRDLQQPRIEDCLVVPGIASEIRGLDERG